MMISDDYERWWWMMMIPQLPQLPQLPLRALVGVCVCVCAFVYLCARVIVCVCAFVRRCARAYSCVCLSGLCAPLVLDWSSRWAIQVSSLLVGYCRDSVVFACASWPGSVSAHHHRHVGHRRHNCFCPIQGSVRIRRVLNRIVQCGGTAGAPPVHPATPATVRMCVCMYVCVYVMRVMYVVRVAYVCMYVVYAHYVCCVLCVFTVCVYVCHACVYMWDVTLCAYVLYVCVGCVYVCCVCMLDMYAMCVYFMLICVFVRTVVRWVVYVCFVRALII